MVTTLSLFVVVVLGAIAFAVISAQSARRARETRALPDEQPDPPHEARAHVSVAPRTRVPAQPTSNAVPSNAAAARASDPRTNTARIAERVEPAPRHQSAATLVDCWLPPGTPAKLGPWQTSDGMFYLRRTTTQRVAEEEASLVDAALAHGRPGVPQGSMAMPYWPRYAQIDPGARAEYLDWHAGGRRDPNVQIGCVFLFLYGLERRILVDAPRRADARAELPTLLAEIEALLATYGENHSFRGYADRLLGLGRAMFLPSDNVHEGLMQSESSPDESDIESESLRLRLELGRAVRDRRPIDARLALAWYLSVPLWLRTPAKRCWREFRDLFAERFAAQFGDGMTVEPNRTRLKFEYVAASPSLARGGFEIVPVDDPLPDVMRLTRPVRKIAEIVDACTEELDAYSRWLGRNQSASSTLRAFALLPPSLVVHHRSVALHALRAWLEKTVEGVPRATVEADHLFEHWPPDKGNKMSKKDTTLLVQLLDKLGYGVEPDVRFGGPVLDRGSKAVVFRTSGAVPAVPSTSYQGAAALLHIAAAVASSDGEVASEEQHALDAQLLTIKALAPAERVRLGAHVEWLLASGVSLRGIQKRLEALDTRARRSIATFAIAVAGADGRVDRKEVKALEKIYAALGLATNELFDDLHEMTSSAGGEPAVDPVVVRGAKPGDPGFRIPSAPAKKSVPAGGVQLDMKVVRAKLAETAAVSDLLAGIFVEETDVPTEPSDVPETEGDAPALPAPGVLDAPHLAFVRALAAKTSWIQSEVETLAREHSLLPDGALDVINEAALDRCGEPALDGTDPVDVNLEIVEELLR